MRAEVGRAAGQQDMSLTELLEQGAQHRRRPATGLIEAGQLDVRGPGADRRRRWSPASHDGPHPRHRDAPSRLVRIGRPWGWPAGTGTTGPGYQLTPSP